MQRPSAIFFDLDQTLLDGRGVREAVQRTCAVIAARIGLAVERVQEENSRAYRVYQPQADQDWQLGRLSGQELVTEVWRRALRACGHDDEALAAEAWEVHRTHERETARLFDDARPTLATLGRNHALGLITNGASDTQRDKLQATELGPCFGAIVISGEAGVRKPDLEIFERALARLSADAASAWHVGDNLRTDVGGAKAAGLTAVWLNRAGAALPEDGERPDHEIRSLSELPALVAEAR